MGINIITGINGVGKTSLIKEISNITNSIEGSKEYSLFIKKEISQIINEKDVDYDFLQKISLDKHAFYRKKFFDLLVQKKEDIFIDWHLLFYKNNFCFSSIENVIQYVDSIILLESSNENILDRIKYESNGHKSREEICKNLELLNNRKEEIKKHFLYLTGTYNINGINIQNNDSKKQLFLKFKQKLGF